MNQHEFDESSTKMMAACNRQNHDEGDTILEIAPADEKQLASRDGFGCETPVEFFVKQKANRGDYMIGFMVREFCKCNDRIVVANQLISHGQLILILYV